MMFDADISACIKTLKEGGIILYPTDTVWGLGCDATNAQAIEKIMQLKKRPPQKSMIILLSDERMLNKYISHVPAAAWDIIENTERPTTIIYDKANGLAKNVLAEDGSIGARVVNEDFCKKLISKFGKPIVSTSANISGEPAPEIYDDISDEIISGADYVVNYRQDDINRHKPSAIIKIAENGIFKIIRS